MAKETSSSVVDWKALGVLTCQRCHLKTSDEAVLQFHNCKTKSNSSTNCASTESQSVASHVLPTSHSVSSTANINAAHSKTESVSARNTSTSELSPLAMNRLIPNPFSGFTRPVPFPTHAASSPSRSSLPSAANRGMPNSTGIERNTVTYVASSTSGTVPLSASVVLPNFPADSVHTSLGTPGLSVSHTEPSLVNSGVRCSEAVQNEAPIVQASASGKAPDSNVIHVSQPMAVIRYSRASCKFTCSLCQEDFAELEFVEHLQAHLLLAPYKCKYCDSEFRTRADVYFHVGSHHSGQEKCFDLKVSSNTKNMIRKAKNDPKGTWFYKPLNRKVPRSDVPQAFASRQSSIPISQSTPYSPRGGQGLLNSVNKGVPYYIVPLAVPVASVAGVTPGGSLIVASPSQPLRSVTSVKAATSAMHKPLPSLIPTSPQLSHLQLNQAHSGRAVISEGFTSSPQPSHEMQQISVENCDSFAVSAMTRGNSTRTFSRLTSLKESSGVFDLRKDPVESQKFSEVSTFKNLCQQVFDSAQKQPVDGAHNESDDKSSKDLNSTDKSSKSPSNTASQQCGQQLLGASISVPSSAEAQGHTRAPLSPPSDSNPVNVENIHEMQFSDKIQSYFKELKNTLKALRGIYLCIECKKKWADPLLFLKHTWDHIHPSMCQCSEEFQREISCCYVKGALQIVCSNAYEEMPTAIKQYISGKAPEKGNIPLKEETIEEKNDPAENAPISENFSSPENSAVGSSCPLGQSEEQATQDLGYAATTCTVSVPPKLVTASQTDSYVGGNLQAKTTNPDLNDDSVNASQPDNVSNVKFRNRMPKALNKESDSSSLANTESHQSSNKGSVMMAAGALSIRTNERCRSDADVNSISNEGHKESTLPLFYKCGFPECFFASCNPVDFLLHTSHSHGLESAYPCIYCGYTGNQCSMLLSHMEEHIVKDENSKFMYSCSLVDDSGNVDFKHQKLDSMFKMIKRCAAEDTSTDASYRLLCKNCDQTFDSLEKLEQHYGDSLLLTVVECRYCRGYFLDSDSCSKHISSKHPNSPRFYRISKKLLCKENEAMGIAFESFKKLMKKTQQISKPIDTRTNKEGARRDSAPASVGIDRVGEEQQGGPSVEQANLASESMLLSETEVATTCQLNPKEPVIEESRKVAQSGAAADLAKSQTTSSVGRFQQEDTGESLPSENLALPPEELDPKRTDSLKTLPLEKASVDCNVMNEKNIEDQTSKESGTSEISEPDTSVHERNDVGLNVFQDVEDESQQKDNQTQLSEDENSSSIDLQEKDNEDSECGRKPSKSQYCLKQVERDQNKPSEEPDASHDSQRKNDHSEAEKQLSVSEASQIQKNQDNESERHDPAPNDTDQGGSKDCQSGNQSSNSTLLEDKECATQNDNLGSVDLAIHGEKDSDVTCAPPQSENPLSGENAGLKNMVETEKVHEPNSSLQGAKEKSLEQKRIERCGIFETSESILPLCTFDRTDKIGSNNRHPLWDQIEVVGSGVSESAQENVNTSAPQSLSDNIFERLGSGILTAPTPSAVVNHQQTMVSVESDQRELNLHTRSDGESNVSKPDGEEPEDAGPQTQQSQWPRIYDICGNEELNNCVQNLFITDKTGKYTCKKCAKRFKGLKVIHCHILCCIGGIGIVLCPHCLYQDAHPKLITNHIKKEHPDKSDAEKIFRQVNWPCLFKTLQNQTLTIESFQSICKPFTADERTLKKQSLTQHPTSLGVQEEQNETQLDLGTQRPCETDTNQAPEKCSAKGDELVQKSLLGKRQAAEALGLVSCSSSPKQINVSSSTSVEQPDSLELSGPQEKEAEIPRSSLQLPCENEVASSKSASSVPAPHCNVNQKQDQGMDLQNSDCRNSFFFLCSLCQYKSYAFTEVQKHKKQKHGGISVKIKKIRDQAPESPEVRMKYKCRLCQVEYKEWDDKSMQKHIDEKHKFYTCPHCAQPYYILSHLHRHMRLSHKDCETKVDVFSPASMFLKVLIRDSEAVPSVEVENSAEEVENPSLLQNDGKSGTDETSPVVDISSVVQKTVKHQYTGLKRGKRPSKVPSRKSGKTPRLTCDSLPSVESLGEGVVSGVLIDSQNVCSQSALQEGAGEKQVPEHTIKCNFCHARFKSVQTLKTHMSLIHRGQQTKDIGDATLRMQSAQTLVEEEVPAQTKDQLEECSLLKKTQSLNKPGEESGNPDHSEGKSVDEAPAEIEDHSTPSNSTTDKSASSAPARYSCHLCEAVLNTEFFFRLHLAKHGGFSHLSTLTSTDGLLLCSRCGYIAFSMNDLAHHTGLHMNERRYYCSLCGNDDHKKTSVVAHIKKFHHQDPRATVKDREELKKSVNLKPKLVSLDPVVVVSDVFRQSSGNLRSLLSRNGISLVDIFVDPSSEILEFGKDNEHFDVTIL